MDLMLLPRAEVTQILQKRFAASAQRSRRKADAKDDAPVEPGTVKQRAIGDDEDWSELVCRSLLISAGSAVPFAKSA